MVRCKVFFLTFWLFCRNRCFECVEGNSLNNQAGAQRPLLGCDFLSKSLPTIEPHHPQRFCHDAPGFGPPGGLAPAGDVLARPASSISAGFAFTFIFREQCLAACFREQCFSLTLRVSHSCFFWLSSPGISGGLLCWSNVGVRIHFCLKRSTSTRTTLKVYTATWAVDGVLSKVLC